MRWVGIVVGVFVLTAFAGAALAELPEANPEDLRGLYKTLEGATKSAEPPRETKTAKGYLRFLGAPPGAVFRVSATGSADPTVTAAAFLQKHGRAFGAVSARSAFEPAATKLENGRGSVCLDQAYSGVPVFGARVYVQTDTTGGVLSTLSDIMRETSLLDSNAVSISPTVTLERAQAQALDLMRSTYGGTGFDVLDGQLFVFSPPVVGDSGDPCLVWGIVAASQTNRLAKEVILVDAHTLDIRLHHAVVPQARERQIYDAGNTYSVPGLLVRSEGDPPSSLPDANQAYDYLGDTYDFYMDRHGRDSIDGMGMVLSATVRFCDPYYECPLMNAFYDDSGGRMYFGDGMVADDVTAHELTHGVTAKSSNLAYYYESGAINESFSDIWGEFVDLTNGRGDDGPDKRWLMGEDTPFGALRSMADPTLFGDPAIYYDPYWYHGDADNGGVHFNCGVGNKLCYLLTDGGTFNGYSIQGIGIDKAAEVFYRVQDVLIPSAKGSFAEKVLKAAYVDYADLGDLLVQSVNDLTILESTRFDEDDVRSVKSAAYAVEILQFPGQPLKEFRAMTVENEPAVVMTWANPVYPFFDQAVVVRNANRAPVNMYDGQVVYTGSQNWAIDEPLTLGNTYHYAVFALFSDTEPPQYRYGSAQVGSGGMGVAYESFSSGSDLSYKQILFTPVGDAGDGGYTITVKPNVLTLPHTSANAQFFHLLEDGYIRWNFSEPFPFAGEYKSHCWIAENGFLSFGSGPVPRYSYLNFPSGSSLNAMARICAAFTDLSNISSGSIWGKVLPDRSVITFDKLPLWGRHYYTNTAQVELFYSGHIRITCLELTAPELVTGVTDGQGLFYDPEILLNHGMLVTKTLDISALPDGSRTVTIEPISPITVNEGMRAEFRIVAHSPGGAPTITVSNLPSGAQVTSVSPTESVFSWLTGYDDRGNHTVLVQASEGGLSASQNVVIHVGNVYREPAASQVEVTPLTPAMGNTLSVSWSLHSPEDDGSHNVYIEWYRNGSLMLPLLNAPTVPGFATNQGDVWYAILTPYSVFGSEAAVGEPVASNVVTVGPPGDGDSSSGGAGGGAKLVDVNVDGVINAIDIQLVINGVLGTGVVPTADVNRDGVTNAIDVQMVVNGVLAF